MDRKQLFRIFFQVAFLLLLFQLLRIISPFYTGILGAIVITLIFFPVHRWLQKKVGNHRMNLAAAISTVMVIVFTVIPFIFFTWLMLGEIKTVYPLAERVAGVIERWKSGANLFHNPFLSMLEVRLQDFLNLFHVDLQSIVMGTTMGITNMLVEVTKSLPRNAFILFVNMMVMIFTLFFLFRDGQTLFRRAKDLVPMDEKNKDNIANQLYITVTAVVRGVFIVAAAQGTFAGIGFALIQNPSPVLLGFITMLVALIPFVGAATVWIPVSAIYLLQGSVGKAIFIFLWGTFLVSLVDNFLRPILIGSRAGLPILFLFFGILGGIKVYGPMGLFLGPLVVALLVAFVRIYREEYVAQRGPQEQGGGGERP